MDFVKKPITLTLEVHSHQHHETYCPKRFWNCFLLYCHLLPHLSLFHWSGLWVKAVEFTQFYHYEFKVVSKLFHRCQQFHHWALHFKPLKRSSWRVKCSMWQEKAVSEENRVVMDRGWGRRGWSWWIWLILVCRKSWVYAGKTVDLNCGILFYFSVNWLIPAQNVDYSCYLITRNMYHHKAMSRIW